jgi:putative transposase
MSSDVHLRGYRALRRGRFSQRGQVYLVTFVTVGRRRLFLDPRLAHVAARVMADSRNWQCSRLLAWVLMPDHWHGLIELGEDQVLSNVVGRIKANSSRELRLASPRLAVWAAGFHDRALRDEDDLEDNARYLAMNPVRAGLVWRAGDYSYWDAVWRWDLAELDGRNC